MGDPGIPRLAAELAVYVLSDDSSPSPPAVAQLMAERIGRAVSSPRNCRPWDGKRPMPRLTQAAIAGGISLVSIGVVVAGGFWLYGHTPYYVAEFLLSLCLEWLA